MSLMISLQWKDALIYFRLKEWKGINRKQSTRWQHLSQLKARAFFSLQKNLVVMKYRNLYLGLVLPSGGWQSLIGLTVCPWQAFSTKRNMALLLIGAIRKLQSKWIVVNTVPGPQCSCGQVFLRRFLRCRWAGIDHLLKVLWILC